MFPKDTLQTSFGQQFCSLESPLVARNRYLAPLMAGRKHKNGSNEPRTIENRRARHDYSIGDTLECGIELRGTEVKSIRAGAASLAEGWIRASIEPYTLTLHSVHVAEYAPAGPRQHDPTRVRRLLAHKREIKKLVQATDGQSTTLVPLKIYFKDGRAKVLLGVAAGKRKADKRQDLMKREAERDMSRAMSQRRL
jgi:SsrA-binding protein